MLSWFLYHWSPTTSEVMIRVFGTEDLPKYLNDFETAAT